VDRLPRLSVVATLALALVTLLPDPTAVKAERKQRLRRGVDLD
jgi:hypothetical protein